MFGRRVLFLVIALGVSFNVSAGELWESVKETTGEAVAQSREAASDVVSSVKASSKKQSSADIREAHNFGINLAVAPVAFAFPMAKGVNANFYTGRNWAFGVDYLSSAYAIKFFSFEIGEITEQHFTLQARRYIGNSFNLKFGVGRRNLEAKLAKDWFDLATANYSETVSEIQTDYLRFGFGNQWQFSKKYTVVLDWLTVNVPFRGEVLESASKYASSDSRRDDIKHAESVLKYYPSGTVVQFEVGLLF